MSTIRFSAVIKIHGINPYVLISAARIKSLKPGWKKPLPVLVRINDKPEKKRWHINMMPTGTGSFWLYLHGDIRKASSTKVGDRVEVEVSFDEKYRGGPAHPMPPLFRSALKNNAKARAAWEELIPSRKKEILRYFASLKSSEALARNLARAMNALSGSPIRFMARSWGKEGKTLTKK
jgi:hypothetical protein